MKRRTKEVEISAELDRGMEISTGDEVLDHLLKTLLFYMERPGKITATSDLRHHLWEDTGILLGKLIKKEAGKRKISRYGSAVFPMDESLVLAVVDVSRSCFVSDLKPEEEEEGFSLTLTEQFLNALSRSLEATIHLKQLRGGNAHHLIEAGFKSLGVALGEALQNSERVESTKGGLA